MHSAVVGAPHRRAVPDTPVLLADGGVAFSGVLGPDPAALRAGRAVHAYGTFLSCRRAAAASRG